MRTGIAQQEINEIVWQACDTFRGTLDPTQYKDYILVMLFIKYLSDLWKDRQEQYRERYQGDERRVERALSRERFVMPKVELKDQDNNVEESFPASFDSLYERRTRSNIGELINITSGKDRGRQQGQTRKRLPQHRLQLRAESRPD